MIARLVGAVPSINYIWGYQFGPQIDKLFASERCIWLARAGGTPCVHGANIASMSEPSHGLASERILEDLDSQTNGLSGEGLGGGPKYAEPRARLR